MNERGKCELSLSWIRHPCHGFSYSLAKVGHLPITKFFGSGQYLSHIVSNMICNLVADCYLLLFPMARPPCSKCRAVTSTKDVWFPSTRNSRGSLERRVNVAYRPRSMHSTCGPGRRGRRSMMILTSEHCLRPIVMTTTTRTDNVVNCRRAL